MNIEMICFQLRGNACGYRMDTYNNYADALEMGDEDAIALLTCKQFKNLEISANNFREVKRAKELGITQYDFDFFGRVDFRNKLNNYIVEKIFIDEYNHYSIALLPNGCYIYELEYCNNRSKGTRGLNIWHDVHATTIECKKAIAKKAIQLFKREKKTSSIYHYYRQMLEGLLSNCIQLDLFN